MIAIVAILILDFSQSLPAVIRWSQWWFACIISDELVTALSTVSGNTSEPGAAW